MRLFSLLGELGVSPAAEDAEIVNITDNVENVRQGSLFVCIRGSRTDGNTLAPQALALGAAAVVSDAPAEAPNAVRVENARLAYSRLCAAFYGQPDRALRLIGITGTNGKTTTAHYLRFLLENAGHKCAVIGTLGADVGAGETPTGFTTPGPDTFFAALRQAADRGFEYCVCEVSSQALAQYRVDGARFRLGVVTNVGRDHLDYHRTLQHLVEAKCRLCLLSDRMLLNADDAYCDRFAAAAAGRPVSLYSCGAVLSDFAAKNIRLQADGAQYILFNGRELARVTQNAPGLFSVYNALGASAAAMLEGVPLQTVAPLLAKLPQIPGRMQRIVKNGVNFCVDFAHTPDALCAVLTALRETAEGKLITVFGCGGDRDRAKRPFMGETAARFSDAVVITSDNPRGEDPLAIISEIRAGVRKKANVFCQPDRAAAIRLAYGKASPGDTVLVAGKGHETVQIAGGCETPFSDADIINGL